MRFKFWSVADSADPTTAGSPPISLGKRLAWLTCLILLSVFAIGLFLNKIPSGHGLSHLRNATLGRIDGLMLVFALLAHLGSLGFEAWQLNYLAKSIGRPACFRRMLKIFLVGNLFAHITPASLGGDPAQLYLLSRNGYSLADGSFLLALRGFLSIAVRILIVAVLGMTFVPSRSWPTSALWSALAVLAGGGLIFILIILIMLIPAERGRVRIAAFLAKRPRWFRLFRCRNEQEFLQRSEDFSRRIRSLWTLVVRKNRSIPVVALGLSALIWLLAKSVPFFILKAFGESPSWPVVITAGILAQIAVAWVPTPGSVGAAEASLSLFFYPLIVHRDPSVLIPVFILLYRFFEVPLNVVVGLPATRRLFRPKT